MFAVNPRDPYGAASAVLWLYVVPLGVVLIAILAWIVVSMFK